MGDQIDALEQDSPAKFVDPYRTGFVNPAAKITAYFSFAAGGVLDPATICVGTAMPKQMSTFGIFAQPVQLGLAAVTRSAPCASALQA